MRPHLIVDIRDRSIFSLLLDSDGNIHPFTHHVKAHTLRYFFGEIQLNLELYSGLKGKQKSTLFETTNSSEYDIERIGKTLGWQWPYQTGNENSAISIKHPLQVLSSVLPLENKKIIKSIMIACYRIMEFIIEPIFQYARSMAPDLSTFNMIAIIPHYFNRRAQVMLHQLLKMKKFHNIRIIYREMATVMSHLEISTVEKALILDMENEDTQLYEVAVQPSQDVFHLDCTNCSTLQQFGWQSLVNQLIDILIAQRVLTEPSVKYQSWMDSTLMALIFGINPSQSQWHSSLKITHGLLDTLFTETGAGLPIQQYAAKLRDWMDKNSSRALLIPLGLPFMIGHLEHLVYQVLKKTENPHALLHRSLERTAYGMAAGLNWLHQGTTRIIKITSHAGFRIATRPDESIELVSYTSLPQHPGESRIIKQVLDFRLDETVIEETLHFQLLWGMNPIPQYNIHVCLMALDIKQEDHREKRKIWVTLHLKKADRENSLLGSITIRLGNQIKKTNFAVDHITQEVHSHDIN